MRAISPRSAKTPRPYATWPTDESQNSVPVLVQAAKAYVTLGEMVEALKAEWGVYSEQAMF
jgi:methylmalonyl-CoA mutase N-terminal domain/subunit